MKAIMIAIMAMFATVAAHAAEVTGDIRDGYGYIYYVGATEDGDLRKVMNMHERVKNAPNGVIIVLHGPGGLASEGEAVGRFVQNKGMSTLVLSGSKCVSACTSIWLSGNVRMLQDGGELWFHLPYVPGGSAFEGHPYENAKNNYGWGALIDYHNSMILASVAYDLSMGIADVVWYVREMGKTGPDVFIKITNEAELQRIGGYWIK